MYGSTIQQQLGIHWWSEKMIKKAEIGRERETKESEIQRKRERWMSCYCLSTVSRELEPDPGRGTAARGWYVCKGSGGSAGAGITLQAGKGLWRWRRGWRWRVSAPVWYIAVCSTHTDTNRHGHTAPQAIGSCSHRPVSRRDAAWGSWMCCWCQSMHAPAVTKEVGVKHILTCNSAAVSTAVLPTADKGDTLLMHSCFWEIVIVF